MCLFRPKKSWWRDESGGIFVGVVSLCFLLVSVLTLFTALSYDQQYALYLDKQQRIGKMLIYDVWHDVQSSFETQRGHRKERREKLKQDRQRLEMERHKLDEEKRGLEEKLQTVERDVKKWESEKDKHAKALQEAFDYKERLTSDYEAKQKQIEQLEQQRQGVEQEVKNLEKEPVIPFNLVRYNVGQVRVLQDHAKVTLISEQANGYVVQLVFYNTFDDLLDS